MGTKRLGWNAQREWLIDEIENDALQYRQLPNDTTKSVVSGRLDAMCRVGLFYDFWDEDTVLDRIGKWIEDPKGRRLREVLEG